MGGVDLDPIEAGLLASSGCIGEGLDGGLDLPERHFSRGLGKERLVYCRRGNGLGNSFFRGIHTAVVDLRDDPTSQAVNGPSELRQIGDKIVGVDPGHLRMGFPGGVHVHVTGDDQSHPAAGQLLIELRKRREWTPVRICHSLGSR
jgi:hypothetical protein